MLRFQIEKYKMPGLALMCLLFSFSGLNAQGVLDGVYTNQENSSRCHIHCNFNYPYCGDTSSLMWEKRVWRIIDSKEKINKPFFYISTGHSKSLWQVLTYVLSTTPDSLKLYRYSDAVPEPPFCSPFSIMVRSNAATVSGSDTAYGLMDICPDEVIEWEIMEDWYFDRARSVLDVKIIGVSPRVRTVDPVSCETKETRNLFWIYYPEFQKILKRYELPVTGYCCEMERYKFDHLFWKRMFSSYIRRETNVYDKSISQPFMLKQ